uniref:Uncharacterized protein n=1 Tax=Arundo donax TaxID=35708 RepID=A0A0A9BB88_ARUDO
MMMMFVGTICLIFGKPNSHSDSYSDIGVPYLPFLGSCKYRAFLPLPFSWVLHSHVPTHTCYYSTMSCVLCITFTTRLVY